MTLYQSALLRDHASSNTRLAWLDTRPPSLPTEPGALLTDAQVEQIDLRESLTLEIRRQRAILYLRARGNYILDQGSRRPSWGIPASDARPLIAQLIRIAETEVA